MALQLDLFYLSYTETTWHNSVKNCKMHFVDDTNLLLTNSSLKKVIRQVNHDLSLICHWLRANKISLNTSKTEIIIFSPSTEEANNKTSQFQNQWLKSQHLQQVNLQENLEWNLHLSLLKSKPNRAIGLFCKIRHYSYTKLSTENAALNHFIPI